jgi:hypothetical protein
MGLAVDFNSQGLYNLKMNNYVNTTNLQGRSPGSAGVAVEV